MRRDDAITQADRPCWHLRLPNGEEPFHGDWPDTHYTAADEATSAAKRIGAGYEPVLNLIPARLDTPCWTATAVCGYRYDEHGDPGGLEHWPDRKSLLDMLLGLGWKPVAGGGMTCGNDDCDTCRDLLTLPPPAEIPGQIALPVVAAGAPSLVLVSDGLLSKWGFNDGNPFEDITAWFHDQHSTGLMRYCDCPTFDLGVSDDDLLRTLVRRYLLPALDQRVEVYDVETSHNPIRASTVDGVPVPDEVMYGRTDGPSLTPECVEIPYDAVLAVVAELKTSGAGHDPA